MQQKGKTENLNATKKQPKQKLTVRFSHSQFNYLLNYFINNSIL